MMGEELKMGIDKMMNGRPRMAIVDPNMLAVLGLKQILQKVIPIITVEAFSNFQEFAIVLKIGLSLQKDSTKQLC